MKHNQIITCQINKNSSYQEIYKYKINLIKLIKFKVDWTFESLSVVVVCFISGCTHSLIHVSVRGYVITVPGDWSSNCSLPVLIHDDSILRQLLLNQNDLLLTFYNEITSCEETQWTRWTNTSRYLVLLLFFLLYFFLHAFVSWMFFL